MFFEFNLRRDLVSISRFHFYWMTGVTFRKYYDPTSLEQITNYEGINLGFGAYYKKDHWSFFLIEKLHLAKIN